MFQFIDLRNKKFSTIETSGRVQFYRTRLIIKFKLKDQQFVKSCVPYTKKNKEKTVYITNHNGNAEKMK